MRLLQRTASGLGLMRAFPKESQAPYDFANGSQKQYHSIFTWIFITEGQGLVLSYLFVLDAKTEG